MIPLSAVAPAACVRRPDLPWTSDAEHVTPWQVLTMVAVCDACPAFTECRRAVDALAITGGFWAGRDRDPNAAQPVLPALWMQPEAA